MASISKQFLSQSYGGELINITSTTTGGDTIHVCPSGTASMDEVYLFAVNNDTSDVTLTLVWGTNAAEINFVIPSKVGLVPVVEKLLLQNNTGVSAYADVSTAINIAGYINRITL